MASAFCVLWLSSWGGCDTRSLEIRFLPARRVFFWGSFLPTREKKKHSPFASSQDFKGNDDAQKDGPCDYLPDVSPPTCGYIDVSKNRPGGLNHKGSVDFYRREKPIFNIVAAKYNATSTRN